MIHMISNLIYRLPPPAEMHPVFIFLKCARKVSRSPDQLFHKNISNQTQVEELRHNAINRPALEYIDVMAEVAPPRSIPLLANRRIRMLNWVA